MNHCIRTDDSIIITILVNNEPSINNHRGHQHLHHHWPRKFIHQQLAVVDHLDKRIATGSTRLRTLIVILGKMAGWFLGQYETRKVQHRQYQRSSACHNQLINMDRQTCGQQALSAKWPRLNGTNMSDLSVFLTVFGRSGFERQYVICDVYILHFYSWYCRNWMVEIRRGPNRKLLSRSCIDPNNSKHNAFLRYQNSTRQ
jgi:hypothetical protein